MKGDITAMLTEARNGSPAVLNRLFEIASDELRSIARRQIRLRRPGETLRTTALVNEAYLKLFDQSRLNVKDRAHFFALSARAMRQILIDNFRRRSAAKRGGGAVPLDLESGDIPAPDRGETLLALDEALERLAGLDERMARVVEYRFFGGMTEPEISEVVGVSERTVRKDWVRARAWLRRELSATD